MQWQELFGGLANLGDPAGRPIREALQDVSLPAGATLLRQGDVCSHYLMVIAGTVKVFSRTEAGRELVLYRIRPGGTCILTTSCLLGNDRFPAEGVAETDVQALLLPAALFNRGLIESPGFRRFVFESYGHRVKDLIVLVEQIAFARVDVRLAGLLLAQAAPVLHATHQELAAELGTAREVVSRLLKEFEHKGWVRLGRGSIEVVAAPALEAYRHERAV